MTAINHANNFGTNLTTNTAAGDTTSPLNSIPSIAAPFYIAFDATNANGHYEVKKITSKTATNVNHSALAYTHTTAEEVRMVVPSEELDEISSVINTGWNSVSDSWAYASASTITVPAGAASLYQKGDKIKLTQTTVKYFYVIGVADTVLTVTGGSDYTVANAEISEIYVSHIENPIGFPSYFSWTPGLAYLSGGTINYAKFAMIGKTVHYRFKYTLSGANISGAVTVSLPVPAHADYSTSVYEPIGSVVLRDTGTSSYAAIATWATGGYIVIRIMNAAGTYVTNVTDISSTVPFTWANTDQIFIEGTYEAA